MKKRQDIEGLLDILETGDIKECCEVISMLGELKTVRRLIPYRISETDDITGTFKCRMGAGEMDM